MKTSVENPNLKLQQSYYETLEKNQLDIRKLRHDMNNQLSVVGLLLKQKEIEKAETYFDSLYDKFRVSNRVFCKNGIVNAVLNVKYNLAMENQIDCFFNIAIDGLVPIENVDLCSIFANIVEKYQGTLDITYTEHEFTLLILI